MKLYRSATGVVAVLLALVAIPSGAAESQGELNKQILQRFLGEMRTAGYVHHNVSEIRAVVERYVAPQYLQHSKKRSPGRDGLVNDYAAIVAKLPQGAAPPDPGDLYFVADRDLVVWVSRKPDFAHPGQTTDELIFQMIRFENGKMVEHWDSIE